MTDRLRWPAAPASPGQVALLLISVDVPAGVTVAVEARGGAWRSDGTGLQKGRLQIELGELPTAVRFRFGGTRSLAFESLNPIDARVLPLLPQPSPAPRP